MAIIRGNVLWTCHHVGLDGADEAYGGNGTGEGVDRSAIQWFSLHIEAGDLELWGTTDWGRIRDEGASHPHWYYYPSLMVNSEGAMVVGFSGSSETSRIGAYYSWRSGPGVTMEGPLLIKAGEDSYGDSFWADYSYTSLDPADGTTIWTVQEYARPRDLVVPIPASWGTWVGIISFE